MFQGNLVDVDNFVIGIGVFCFMLEVNKGRIMFEF